MKLKIIILILINIIGGYNLYGQDSIVSKSSKISFNGYVKDMQTILFSNPKDSWLTDNLIHNRLNFKWYISNAFTFCLEERNRFIWGELVKAIPDYKTYIAYDNGLVNMSWNIFSDTSFVLNATIDRGWIDFSKGNFELTLGRQRINWSQTFVWNPNDIFNTYSYFDFDYEEKPGTDAFRLQYFTGAASKFEFAIKADKQYNITAAAFYKFNKHKYDFQFLGGLYDQNKIVGGFGWAGQIAKGGFKGETTYFYPTDNFTDTTGVFLASVEYDYTFKNSIFLQFEGLYNSNPVNNSNIILSQFNPEFMSAENPFLNGFSIFENISYPVTPLINVSLSGIYNPNNKMYFIIPTFTFSLMNNLDLSLIGQSFQSYDSNNPVKSENFIFIRLKGSF